MSSVRIPVLEYHLVLPDDVVAGSPDLADNPYVVPVSDFDRQMQAIADYGCTPIDTSQMYRYLTGQAEPPPNPVSITFDDGYEAIYRHAFPILAALGFRFTMFVLASFIRDAHLANYRPDDLPYTSWEALREMVDTRLCDVQSHTWNLHDDSNGNSGLNTAGTDVAWQDLLMARRAIETNLGTACTALGYPHGEYTDDVQWLLAYSGHRLAFIGANYTPVTGREDFLALPRYLVQRDTDMSFLTP